MMNMQSLIKDFETINGIDKPKILLFTDKIGSGFGGMEEHRQKFIEFFSDRKESQLLIIFLKPQISVKFNGNVYKLNSFTGLIRLLKSIIKEDDIFFFNDCWWIQHIKTFKRLFRLNKFILRSGGNDLFRAPIYFDSIPLIIRQKVIVKIINVYIDCLIVNSSYSYFRNIESGINPKIMKRIRGGVDSNTVNNLKIKKAENRLLFDSRYRTFNKTLILVACRFVKFKGILEFLTEIKENFNFDKNCLLLLGDGPLYEEIKEKLNRFYPNNHILMHSQKNTDVLKLISISDVVINPSLNFKRYFGKSFYYHTETMGRTMMEAISLNIPIVATNVGGTNELFIENEGKFIGYLVDDFKDFNYVINKISKSKCANSCDYSWNFLFQRYINDIFYSNRLIYCFDIDGTIINKDTDEENIAKFLKKHAKQDNIFIFNTARTLDTATIELAEKSGVRFVIANNGIEIFDLKEEINFEVWNTNNKFEDIDVFYNISVKQFGNKIVEKTHPNCLSILKSHKIFKFIKKHIKKYVELYFVVGDKFIKVLSKKKNKKTALQYLVSVLPQGKLIAAGDATNDIEFVSDSDEGFIADNLKKYIKYKNVKFYKKSLAKLDLLEQIFNE